MAGVTTAFVTQAKKDLLNGGGAHLLAATVTPTGTPTSGSKVIGSVSSVTGIYRGMAISGTGIVAGAIVKSVDSSSQVTMSDNASSSPGSVTLTFAGDVYKIALIKVTPTGTYDAASTKYSDITGNSDEVSGTGYTATGQALANNIGAGVTGTTAFTQWSVNPTWTTATISTVGAMVYNTGAGGPVLLPAIAVYSFGGTQTVTAGTLTILQPTNDATNAMLRLA